MSRIARERWEGKIQKNEVDDQHIAMTYRELTRGASQGYGPRFDTLLDENGDPSPEVIKMRQNLFRFSMAKDLEMLKDINRLLSGGKRVMRWERFKSEVLKLNKKYNINYLQAEWQTALQAGKHAANWEVYNSKYQRELYPNLKYKTQEDDRVRDEHIPLNNIIRPLNDAFWDVAYPPNGWRCRCYVVQTAEDATPSEDMPTITDKDIRPEFRINVGKTGQIFKESDLHDGKPHPYFALALKDKMELKDWMEVMKSFELAKLTYAPHTIYKGKNGGKVLLNIFADKDYLMQNLKKAYKLADHGMIVTLNAHLDPGLIKDHTNPEYLVDGKIADLKSNFKINNYSGIGNCFKSAKRQGCSAIVIDLSDSFKEIDTNRIYRILNGKITKTRGTWIDFIVLSHKKKVIKIERSDFLEHKAENMVEKLKASH